MGADTRYALVVENDPTCDVRLLGSWLADAGLELKVVRPYEGEPIPEALDAAALIVLGGGQHAYPDSQGHRDSPWLPALDALLRAAVAARVPTLGLGLDSQLLAQALGGRVAPAPSPVLGPRLLSRRDAAEYDPLFHAAPMALDVVLSRHDEIISLPPGGTLLAASPYGAIEAFRVGTHAWGMQFHIECDTAMLDRWVSMSGLDPAAAARAVTVLDDVAETWRPVAERFATLALGRIGTGTPLPLLEG